MLQIIDLRPYCIHEGSPVGLVKVLMSWKIRMGAKVDTGLWSGSIP